MGGILSSPKPAPTPTPPPPPPEPPKDAPNAPDTEGLAASRDRAEEAKNRQNRKKMKVPLDVAEGGSGLALS